MRTPPEIFANEKTCRRCAYNRFIIDQGDRGEKRFIILCAKNGTIHTNTTYSCDDFERREEATKEVRP